MRGSIDSGSLRQVLRYIPTSLAVVATMDGPQPLGCTVGSFVTVSLEPPLVAYFAMRSSKTLRAIRRQRTFSVNILAEDQADLADLFARPSVSRFRDVPWWRLASGRPRLGDALVVVDCDLERTRTIGDHTMVLGRVTGATVRRPGVEPLVFAQGRFRGLARDHMVDPGADARLA